jgi:phage FluMu protein Com
MDFIATILTEFGKSVASEAGKAAARALLSRKEEPAAQPDVEHGEWTVEVDPLWEAEAAANGFLQGLAAADHDAAWTWCDPAWPSDPDRARSFHDTIAAAPPINWVVRQHLVPEDWSQGEWLAWVLLDVVVTFDAGDGTFPALPAMIAVIPLESGWRVAEIDWNPQSQAEPESLPEEQAWQIRCERCPQELTIPVGTGPFQIRCPTCWTPQSIDRTAWFLEMFAAQEQPAEPSDLKRVIQCERCPQQISIPIGVGRIRLKCPSCWTPQEIDT